MRRNVGFLAFEELLHHIVVELDDGFDQLGAIFGGLVDEVGGDIDVFEFRAKGLVLPDDPTVSDQVDDALEIALRADRQVKHQRVRAETVNDALNAIVKVRAGAIQLIYEAHPRNAILVRLAPHGFGLGFDARDAVEHRDRAVEDAQGPLDFDGEVHVAGGVDDVDAVLGALAIVGLPERGRGGGGDGDPALLLLLHPVHRRGAVMHLADLVGLAGVIQDALGSRRLAGIDVRHDADIAVALQRVFAGHGEFPREVGGAAVSGPHMGSFTSV